MNDSQPNDVMIKGAMNALGVVLSLEEGEQMLVVTDQEKYGIGSAFAQAGEKMGAQTTLFSLPQEHRPLTAVPEELISLLKGNSIIINAFTGIAEETPFRIKLVKTEISSGARVGHAPGITMRMMTEGPMTADYSEIAQQADHLMGQFVEAVSVHITAPGGTDITLLIEDRDFETDVLIKGGSMGNLPAGEIWCGPVEDGTNGIIVCDGSIGDLGQVPSPVTIRVQDGRIVDISCNDEDFRSRLWELSHVDEMSAIVGELGIGLNPEAKLTGNLLEDEKAGETAHIAFGNNTEMPGGKNTSATHRDFLFYRPTFTVRYRDGSSSVIIRDGKLTV